MLRHHFSFDLPDALIARQPAVRRRDSRLLSMARDGSLRHRHFPDLLEHIHAGDLLVFNNTQVIAARLYGHKATGGKFELLVERVVDKRRALAHVRASKSPPVGSQLTFDEGYSAIVSARAGALFELVFDSPVAAVLEAIGHMPLPPYIDRADTPDDRARYQTVYAKTPGAVAAPTAGLHFDQAMLDAIAERGADIGYVTLHVGAGTFQPVRVEDIQHHQMHAEWIDVDETLCQQVRDARTRSGRVVAVGTTSVRCLESAARGGEIQPFTGDTDIFIYPGYRFAVVDALLTNFHLSESTLLMLVSAFSGYSAIMRAYREAIAEEYRFFSYGDAMFIRHNPDAAEEIPNHDRYAQ